MESLACSLGSPGVRGSASYNETGECIEEEFEMFSGRKHQGPPLKILMDTMKRPPKQRLGYLSGAQFMTFVIVLVGGFAWMYADGLTVDSRLPEASISGLVTRVAYQLQQQPVTPNVHLPMIQNTDIPEEQKDSSASTTYYVSKSGSNADGLSWETAWNELNQIQWNVVRPGDIILLDGGESQAIYTTRLTIRTSGASKKPITIKLADEKGRDGQVVIFGGRSTPLPYCEQETYEYVTEGVRQTGILVRNAAWVVVDGRKWRGIAIYGHNRYGIELYGNTDNITIRNVDIFDNGAAIQRDGVWYSDFPGVNLGGTNITFERALVHDNGQDAFQWHEAIEDFTLRESWLYNSRRHPYLNEAFNWCSHTDGIQIYNGGPQYGFVIEETIFGPALSNGVLMGQALQPSGIQATVHEAVFRDVLFIKATDNNLAGFRDTKSEDWVIDRATVYCETTLWQCLYLEGSGHSVTNSIFVGSWISLPDGLDSFSNNCQWNTRGFRLGQVVDPLFVDADESDPFALGDYTLQPDSPCAGMGSSLTSVGQLLGQPNPDHVNTELFWEAEEGYIAPPFMITDDFIVQPTATDDFHLSGRASYRFEITTTGDYILNMVVDAPDSGANSLFVNINGEPEDSSMIWDIEVTDGFEERTVSWRGDGSPDANEFVPKVFSLPAGQHELIIRGREGNTRIDQIRLEQTDCE